jgi:hypothetical protein
MASRTCRNDDTNSPPTTVTIQLSSARGGYKPKLQCMQGLLACSVAVGSEVK